MIWSCQHFVLWKIKCWDLTLGTKNRGNQKVKAVWEFVPLLAKVTMKCCARPGERSMPPGSALVKIAQAVLWLLSLNGFWIKCAHFTSKRIFFSASPFRINGTSLLHKPTLRLSSHGWEGWLTNKANCYCIKLEKPWLCLAKMSQLYIQNPVSHNTFWNMVGRDYFSIFKQYLKHVKSIQKGLVHNPYTVPEFPLTLVKLHWLYTRWGVRPTECQYNSWC